MMRRGIAVLMVIVMTMMMVTTAFASSSLNLGSLKGNALLEVDINNDGNAFINSVIGLSQF